MKISTKGRYGLRILLDIATHDQDRPRMLSEVCQEQGFSRKYVGRLTLLMRNAGLIRSYRGARGGYKLVRAPKEISLLDIVESLEGPVSIIDCLVAEKSPKKKTQMPPECMGCLAHKVWGALNNEIRSSLSKVSLQDIIDHNFRIGHNPPEKANRCKSKKK